MSDQVWRYAVRVLLGVDDPGAVEDLEHDLGEREEGLEQILLVDGRSPRRVPMHSRVVLDQPPDRGVHEPDVTNVRVAVCTELEATRLHDVEMELSRLVQPALGVGLEPGRQTEDLDASPAGICRRECGRVEGSEHVRPPAGEALLAGGNELGVNPRGRVVLALQESGQRGVGHFVLLDHQRSEGGRGVGGPCEEAGHDFVRGGISLRAEAVEVVVAPVGHAHVAPTTFRASSRLRLGPPAAISAAHVPSSARIRSGAPSWRAQSVSARNSSILAP